MKLPTTDHDHALNVAVDRIYAKLRRQPLRVQDEWEIVAYVERQLSRSRPGRRIDNAYRDGNSASVYDEPDEIAPFDHEREVVFTDPEFEPTACDPDVLHSWAECVGGMAVHFVIKRIGLLDALNRVWLYTAEVVT